MSKLERLKVSVAERFWPKVEMSAGCWQWLGAKIPAGYGTLQVKENTKLAHRISWEIHCGEIPAELFVLHHCDNKICVNPDHLFLGTHRDNVDDAVRKGRHLHGEKHHKTKLTDDDVYTIRRQYPLIGSEELARRYNLGRHSFF